MKKKIWHWLLLLSIYSSGVFFVQSATADITEGKIQYYHGESTSESTTQTTSISSEQTTDSRAQQVVVDQKKSNNPRVLAQLGETNNLILLSLGVILFGTAVYYLVLLRRKKK